MTDLTAPPAQAKTQAPNPPSTHEDPTSRDDPRGRRERSAPHVSTRYDPLFARLAERRDGAFIPFTVLGDPGPEETGLVLDTLVEAGADALELGIPFSDPIADGPTIQTATRRALEAGTTPDVCWRLLTDFRARHPEVPVGLLVYANLVAHRAPEAFYAHAAAAGVDSVLVADVPALEAPPFVAAARQAGVAPVMLVPPDVSPDKLERIARLGDAYSYVLTRAGITGARADLAFTHGPLLQSLREAGGPPPVFGFGISRPDHVRAALAVGAAGAISGSAVVARLARHGASPAGIAAVRAFVTEMKAATRAACTFLP